MECRRCYPDLACIPQDVLNKTDIFPSVLEPTCSPAKRTTRTHLPIQIHVARGRTIISAADASTHDEEGISKEIAVRKKEIDQADIVPYPRYARHHPRKTDPRDSSEGPFHSSNLAQFDSLFKSLTPGQEVDVNEVVEGRIRAVRASGSKLVFLDILQGSHKLQILLNARSLRCDETLFRKTRQLLRRGDIISIRGHPHRTMSGQLSLMATELPQILSPCLHHFPVDSHDARPTEEHDSRALDRHVELLTSQEAIQTLVLRSEIINRMRMFFRSEDFIEVETPILAASAGGASARPFETTATEFAERKLSLRIAPELWLKRLIIGGMERIFEIGPSFRNEGLDKTHNPEFTTCEFYSTYTSLPNLLELTTRLLRFLAGGHILRSPASPALFRFNDSLSEKTFHGIRVDPLPQIDFLTTLNSALGEYLPNLASETAQADLVALFEQKAIPLPAKPTLPRLLDKLSSVYLEPQCQNFTFIINHPECMSPLSKSFIHPTAPNDQPVAARAELFVQGRELVNCYEEENSPFEQRRKFKMQQHYARADEGGSVDDEAMSIDEDYLRALEWGLPPTGGWGCGIDRLVMLFAKKERIGDVLSFGNLRAVTRSAEKRKPGDA